MQVTSFNPKFGGGDPEDGETIPVPPGFFERNTRLFKALAMLGMVGLAGFAGYMAGTSVTGAAPDATTAVPTDSTNGDGDESRALSLAKATVKSGFDDPDNVALVSKLSIGQINELVDTYLEDTTGWSDQYLTKEIMDSFVALRAQHDMDSSSAGRLLREGERQLAMNYYDEPLVDLAWEQIEDADYSNAIKYSDDYASVYERSGYCWVVIQESNSLTDWISNLDLGSEDIKSIKTYSTRDESCGCDKWLFWWCSRYKTCSTHTTIGQGYDGFVKPYNAMRLQIASRVASSCSSSSPLVISGYSRGGGIAQVLAYAYSQEGLRSKDLLKLITFGSPRALEDSESDAVHGRFEQYRMVYKNDPAPSVPYSFMGYKHFGTMSCKDCSYTQGRDRPYWSWPGTNIAHHTSYCVFFGDAAC